MEDDNKWQNTVIYEIGCWDDDITERYIGSTIDMRERGKKHSSNCNNCNSEQHNLKVYDFIRKNGGWENWYMVTVEKYPCNSQLEKRVREQFWIDQLNPILNEDRAYRTPNQIIEDHKKKYLENREDRLNQCKEYYAKNIEYITERQKTYNEKHTEKIKLYHQQYQKNNVEEIKLYQQQYYRTHALEIKSKKENLKNFLNSI